MGMDVCGRHPTTEAGEYFRATIWSWPPIHQLMEELCSDLLDEEMLRQMCYNDGAGPEDQQTCTEMANRFDRWLEHNAEGLHLESDIRMTPEGRLLSEQELAENPGQETLSPYQIGDEHLKTWAEFLRHCGGFEVW
jgi:hypothetical protein